MARDTRTWSVPTSPRNPDKLRNELELFSRFSGQVWSKERQAEFAELLAQSDFFEGSVHEAEPEFTARDRINRAPKSYGLVWQDKRTKVMTITPAGERLIHDERTSELWVKQLLKWQYPSPIHHQTHYVERFRIKPFLEMIRMIRDAGGLTKFELAIFGITLIDYRQYDRALAELNDFRTQLDAAGNRLQKKRFKAGFATSRFSEIYREELEGRQTLVRESGGGSDPERYIKTKIRNARDYADAAIRYFRATGLFSVSRDFKLKIKTSKFSICEGILAGIEREPANYLTDLTSFRSYFVDPNKPNIVSDQLPVAIRLLDETVDAAHAIGFQPAPAEIASIVASNDLITIKNGIERLELKIAEIKNQEYYISLQNNYASLVEVVQMNEKILDRTDDEIPDRPLYFEWNLWRLFSILNHGEIINNGQMDSEGQPVSGAPGNRPDGIGHYRNGVLVIEATMTSGQRQYDAEGESIVRHVGTIQRKQIQDGDTRPVVGVFVAPSISPATIAYLYFTMQIPTELYGGRVRILPLDLCEAEEFAKKCSRTGGFEPNAFFTALEAIFTGRYNSENEWREAIRNLVRLQ